MNTDAQSAGPPKLLATTTRPQHIRLPVSLEKPHAWLVWLGGASLRSFLVAPLHAWLARDVAEAGSAAVLPFSLQLSDTAAEGEEQLGKYAGGAT